MAWQEELEKTLGELGFRAVQSTPCLYYNEKRGIRIVAHVDDLLCVGEKDVLEQFYKDLGAKFEVKGMIVGPSPGRERRGVFLGRTIEWKS